MKISAVILGGGRGLRFGGAQAKQFRLLKGRSVMEYAVMPFLDRSEVIEIILVVPGDYLTRVAALPGWPWSGRLRVVAGGATRQQSSFAGVSRVGGEASHIIIHDAARPLVSGGMLARLLEALHRHDAVTPVVPVTDTLVKIDGTGAAVDFPHRGDYARVQTPQGFRAEVIRGAHAAAVKRGITDATDDCSLVRMTAAAAVFTVAGEENNRKITTAADLELILPRLPGGKGKDA